MVGTVVHVYQCQLIDTYEVEFGTIGGPILVITVPRRLLKMTPVNQPVDTSTQEVGEKPEKSPLNDKDYELPGWENNRNEQKED